MARTRAFDQQKALTEAMHVFWEKGYEATSLSDLTSRMGIQKPSLYAAYGDKSSLFESALRNYNQLHAKSVRSKLVNKTSVKAAFRQLFLDGAFPGGTQEQNGCFCLNTMVELAPHDAKLEILTREHQQYLAAIFQETLERGVNAGEIDRSLDCRAIAQSLLASFVGITVLKKSNLSREWIDNCIESALSLLIAPPSRGPESAHEPRK
ncbi:TetR/AcrR family transcriptional regulator [Cohnella sp. GCM10020058]|uniref:TetR/AcrR family transcriptional regulator n=1 Tax=Cohnella sp. GCM10020058 TaxID=3317330 RepID=UPI00363A3713